MLVIIAVLYDLSLLCVMKTYLHSTITQERLSNLALLYIEKEKIFTKYNSIYEYQVLKKEGCEHSAY